MYFFASSELLVGMVSGGGKKPWKQKGTGRARQGSIRAPQWYHGGTVFGPQPRDYSQRTPKKMKAAALRYALSDRANAGRVAVYHGFREGYFDKQDVARYLGVKQNHIDKFMWEVSKWYV